MVRYDREPDANLRIAGVTSPGNCTNDDHCTIRPGAKTHGANMAETH